MGNEATETQENETKTIAEENKPVLDALYPDDTEERKAEDPASEGDKVESKDSEDQDSEDSSQADSESQDKDSDDEQESEDEKSKDDESKDEEDAPKEVKLELSEESFADQYDIDQVMEFVTEHNLNQDVADELLRHREEAISAAIKRGDEFEERQIEAWGQQVIDDPILGGDNLKATTENARRVLDKFGSEEFTEILNDTGYGNHPEVVGFLARLGEQMSDDTYITGGVFKGKQKSVEEKFYGN